jgi:hypothetical protein
MAWMNANDRRRWERLVDEQAALRRVATLVAANPESDDLFSAVAREVAGVLDVRGVVVDRFEADGSLVIVGSAYHRDLGDAAALLGVGFRMLIRPGMLAATVIETRRVARVADYSTADGQMGDIARTTGLGSGCAAPIVVDGRLWGQMCVYSSVGTVLPANTEPRLEDFVALVATAISSYEAHAAVRRLADEQAGLRRVATLVAKGAQPEEVFAAVAQEATATGQAPTAILRFEENHPASSWLERRPRSSGLRSRSANGGRSTTLRQRPRCTGRAARPGSTMRSRSPRPAVGLASPRPSRARSRSTAVSGAS